MQNWTLYVYRRKWVGSLALAAGLTALTVMIFRVPSVPAIEIEAQHARHQASYKWPERTAIEPRHLEAFKPAQSSTQQADNVAATSYLRLAGTFMTYSNSGEPENGTGFRIAIIDNLKTHKQSMVQKEEVFDGFRVLSVFESYVELSKDDEVFELHANMQQANPPETTIQADEKEKEPTGFGDMPALETNRFGKRIGENRWVFSRKAIMDYYEEVVNDPERVVEMYKSFTTDRNKETDERQGFLLAPAGERDFFNAVGLQNGDVIRKVNSMNMLSQRRAEFMLTEFVNHNLNAVVIDVDREGKEEKMIYLIR